MIACLSATIMHLFGVLRRIIGWEQGKEENSLSTLSLLLTCFVFEIQLGDSSKIRDLITKSHFESLPNVL